MTILVVDDEPVITETLSELLADAGHTVVPAGDGEEALEAFDRRRPDLVVSDVMMPKLDGHELVRAIRAREDGRDVPVILMSAARALGQDATIGHDVFLEKPFDFDEFLEHVTRLGGPGGS